MDIRKVAVIGAGTMGSGIASHLTNAGVDVVLLDVVRPGANSRDAVAADAVKRMLENSPPAFMSRSNAARITTGNIEDDLGLLSDCDWIAEAIVERLDLKQKLYAAIEKVRKPGSMVSSNTSTLPLALLTEQMPESLRTDFCITHFFNPVRYMRLLELVAGPDTRPEVIETLGRFCDVALGKGVVACRDTPGFLANRVGVFALQAGLVEALDSGLTVEEADAVMGRPMGIPKTGLFGLYDLIGLDLMFDVVDSLLMALPPDDAFVEVAPGIPVTRRLVEAGCTGNKGGAGFYRNFGSETEPRREVVDLETGTYRAARRPAVAAVGAAERGGLRALVEHPDAGGRFAWRVLARTLSYAASLVPSVSDEVVPIDEAMKLGYSWSQGPFEMIDALGAGWFRERLERDGMPVPPILESVGDRAFYEVAEGRLHHFVAPDGYRPLERAPGVVRLGDLAAPRAPVIRNDAASVWDIGDGVACVEFHTKANALGPASMDLLRQATGVVAERFEAMLIHSDAPHFSVGFNLDFVRHCIAEGGWAELDAALDAFQQTCRGLKHAPFPVVGAPGGMALGGGFEVLLGCDAVQAHANCVMGLVETMVGLVPAGGGCKEMLHRATLGKSGGERLAGALEVFNLIGMAQTASSPAEARRRRFLRDVDATTMNRDRLLSDGKALALALVPGYRPPAEPEFAALGPAGLEAMEEVLDALREKGVALAHDVTVARGLARILAAGDGAAGESVAEADVLALEREVFVALARTPETGARIEHMLTRGRPLRN